ncbi:Gpr1 family protein [Metarhizium album ARSEF 1941]|uniref:Gpr1 family protein n=1 Tax=Metarhizium album (strain ARSEF 1941) TaxID=1081103 RepID=A0A0B2WM73_METAS|nr:Gpr1 family protein [Metarhizium album ARSEF 1941]KHN97156.1 Gpr1 family protein [Metarhizium album ARSEF 1941]
MSAPLQNNHVAAGQTYKEANGSGYPVFPTTANARPKETAPRHNQSTVSQVYDPQFFKIANPGPLGLISFALTTFVLGLYQCGAGLPNSNPLGSVGPDEAIFGLAVFFGGVVQLVAGIMEFRAGNTFGTTVHCSYAAFWLALAMFMIPQLGIKEAYKGDDRAFSFAVGIFLILWCFLSLVFFIAALRTNITILVVLGLLTLAFLLLSIAQFISTTHTTAAVRVNRAGGVFTVLCAFAAFYAGSAGLMTPATTWVVFPLGEFKHALAQRSPV